MAVLSVPRPWLGTVSGVAAACAAHAFVALLAAAFVFEVWYAGAVGGAFEEGGAFVWLPLTALVVLGVELLLLVSCGTAGGLLIYHGRRGFGLGLLVGWAVGLAVPVATGAQVASHLTY